MVDVCCYLVMCFFFFFFKQKTAYEMRISDWSSDVCSSDLHQMSDTEIYTPLTSRIAHLVVIDVLAMGVAMARGPSLVNHLKSVTRSLRSLRLSPKSVKALDD